MPGKNANRGKSQPNQEKAAVASQSVKKSSSRNNATVKKTFAALRENDEHLKVVLDAAHIGIWEWIIPSNTLQWYGGVMETFNLPRESFVGSFDAYLKLVHPDDIAKIATGIQQSLLLSKPYCVEHRIIMPDGSTRWLEAHGHLFRDKKGQPFKMTGTVQDTTQKKTIESEREDWKTRHELVASSAGIVIYDYDITTGAIIWSGNCQEVLGYTPEQIGNIRQWADLIHDDDRNHAFASLEQAQRVLKAYNVYYRFRLNNGQYCYIHDRGTFLPDAGGKARRMLGMMNNVTGRIKAQQQLEESEQRFRNLQQASFGGIGLHDHGRIIDCNQGLCNITGYSYEELIGSDGINLIAPEWREFVLDRIESGYDATYDVEGLRKDGSRYFLEIRGKDIPFNERTIRVTEFRDITERKRNEEKIVEQNTKLAAVAEDLKRKNNQLEEFTQIVSHNLRSPVGNILTLLTFFESAASEDEKKEYLNLLKESASKTLTMLNELNDVLKVKQNKNIGKQELRFEQVLKQIKSILNAKITAISARVTFDFLKAPVIHYPAIYLESIFLNLLDNALKYHAPERQPLIHFSTDINDTGDIVLQVKDNGLGINLERYGHHVFKLRKTFHHHPESRGIGLFMVKNQIEAMGGEISISSQENEGTAFFINFSKHQSDGY